MKDPKLCSVKFCINKHRKGRTICHTHDKQQWRERYPMKAAFQTLRHNATRRGKTFDLTFEQFENFCYETNYMAGKGRSKKSYSIDRIDNTRGYAANNIQVLTKSNNSKKSNKVLHYDYRTNTATVI